MVVANCTTLYIHVHVFSIPCALFILAHVFGVSLCMCLLPAFGVLLEAGLDGHGKVAAFAYFDDTLLAFTGRWITKMPWYGW